MKDRSFKEMVRELSEQIPISGYVLRYALRPVMLIVFTAIAGFEFASMKFKEFNAATRN